jgi:hypothetical protein
MPMPLTIFNCRVNNSDDLGNFNYGAVGHSLLWANETLLKMAAGVYQIYSGTSTPQWENNGKIWLPPYGDEPWAQLWIGEGYHYTGNK